eukprot:jgi/Mesvir1/23390/Mv21085-RA.1
MDDEVFLQYSEYCYMCEHKIEKGELKPKGPCFPGRCPTCDAEAATWEMVPDANWERQHCVKCIDWNFSSTSIPRPEDPCEADPLYVTPLQLELRQKERIAKKKALDADYRKSLAELKAEEDEDTIYNPKGYPFIVRQLEIDEEEGDVGEEVSDDEFDEALHDTNPYRHQACCPLPPPAKEPVVKKEKIDDKVIYVF